MMGEWICQLLADGFLGSRDWLLVKGSRGMRMETLIDELGNLTAPKLIQIVTAGIFKRGAHFQSVGLHQVKWSQQTIQS